MAALWYCIAAGVFTAYVVLDGFDFGAGALHLMVARDDRERRQVLASIGPFWDGNEVWLLAGGGVLFLAFPKVLAAGLSGFYLAIMLVLWVLILRGIAIEFRSHVRDSMWRAFWDATFSLASAAAPVLLGVAGGNLLRGVPLDERGWFSLPLFESLSPTGALGLLDWYTVLAGVFAASAVYHHGALFLAWKTDGPVRARSLAWADRLFPATIALWLATTAATLAVAPDVLQGVASKPVAWAATAFALAGLVVSRSARRARQDRRAFLGSALFIAGFLVATAASVHPTMLKSASAAELSLTADNASAPAASLEAGLYWWPIGLLLAVGYVAVLFHLHRGRAQAAAEGEGY